MPHKNSLPLLYIIQQIYSNTNNLYTNKQNYKTFSKNQTPVAFCSQQKVLDNISKATLKEMYKEKLINAIKNCDVKVLFEAVGIKATKDLFGKYYTVYGYGKGGGATHNFSELGVDENELANVRLYKNLGFTDNIKTTNRDPICIDENGNYFVGEEYLLMACKL